MRQVRSRAVTVGACVLLWSALVLPSDVHELTPGAFVRIPVEGLLAVAAILVLPQRARRPVSVTFGMTLAVLVVIKALDIGFTAVMDRPFHALYDWYALGAGFHVLSDWVGRVPAVLVVAGGLLAVVGVGIALVRSAERVARVVSGQRWVSEPAVTAGALVWALSAMLGLQTAGAPVASGSTSRLAYDHATGLYDDYRDRRTFAPMIAEDRFADTPADGLLTGLRGKDVLLVSVESYGRVAVTDPEVSTGVNEVLATGTEQLREAGFSARSAYLTSPIVGAGSWMSHATLQSGLWVDNQQRYDLLTQEERLTLTGAFARAGWRTASVAPAIQDGWPEGRSFYGFDTLLDARSLDYQGPKVGWGGIPDQYTLSRLWKEELAREDRDPVMAQIDLVSSHHPWSQPPPLLAWNRVGDGSAFNCMPRCGRDAAGGEESEDVRDQYARTIEYSLRTVTSFVANHPDPGLVVILVGDHQPWSQVTGESPSRDVPITILAHDPEVTRQMSGWGWDAGMRPGPDAPVWRMDAFRDRFLSTFG